MMHTMMPILLSLDFRILVHIEEHVPSWWGIITSEYDGGQVDFYMERQPQPNPQMDTKKKISILWRPELNHILERTGLPAYRQKSKDFVQIPF